MNHARFPNGREFAVKRSAIYLTQGSDLSLRGCAPPAGITIELEAWSRWIRGPGTRAVSNSPELYELLVLRQAWPLERYGRFVAQGMIAALLPPPTL